MKRFVKSSDRNQRARCFLNACTIGWQKILQFEPSTSSLKSSAWQADFRKDFRTSPIYDAGRPPAIREQALGRGECGLDYWSEAVAWPCAVNYRVWGVICLHHDHGAMRNLK
jgi:hypothetical protein